jgi:hypothetical protein
VNTPSASVTGDVQRGQEAASDTLGA